MVREHASRLSRTSLSSIHSQQSSSTQYETIPAEVAHQHAHAAAMIAYLRSQHKQPSDGIMARREEVSKKPSIASIVPNPARADGRGLRRQQSVRFVGVNGLERRESLTTRATNVSIESKQQLAALEPVAMTTNAPVPAVYRPPSRSSSIGKTSVTAHHPPTRRSSIGKTSIHAPHPPSRTSSIGKTSVKTQADSVTTTTLSSLEEQFSTPSSYRRLRRSKSMFSPSKAPSVFYTNGTPKKQYHLRHFRSQSHNLNRQPSKRALRGFKSTSLLYDHQELDNIVNEKHEPDVQQARDRFFQEERKERLRTRPSFLFRSHKDQSNDQSKDYPEKSFRRSVRTRFSSTFSSPVFGSPVSSASSNEQSKRQALKTAAHKASKSIKTKFRRVFGRSKDEPMAIPNQQVEAKESHVRHYNGDSTPISQAFDGFSDIPYPDATTLSRVASRVPSIRIATPSQKLLTSQAPSILITTTSQGLATPHDSSSHIATPSQQSSTVQIATPHHQLPAPQTPHIDNATSKEQIRSHTSSSKSIKADKNDNIITSTTNILNAGQASQTPIRGEQSTEIEHKDDVTTSTSNIYGAGQASRTPIGREIQRLSIINENGAHYPSSSYRRSQYKSLNQASPYPRIPFALSPKNDENSSPTKSIEDEAKEELLKTTQRYLRVVSKERKLSAERKGGVAVLQPRNCSQGSQQSKASSTFQLAGADVKDFFDNWREQELLKEIARERQCSNGSKRSVSSSSNTSMGELQYIFFGIENQKKLESRRQNVEKNSKENLKPNKLARKSSINSIASSLGKRTSGTNKLAHKSSIKSISSSLGKRTPTTNKLVRKSSIHTIATTSGQRTPATIRRVPTSPTSQDQTTNGSPIKWSPTKSSPHKSPSYSTESGRFKRRSSPKKIINHFPPAGKYDPALDDVFSPKDNKDKFILFPMAEPEPRKASDSSTDSLKRAYDRNTQAYLDIPDPVGMSPQKMANRNEGFVPEPKVLHKTKSTFFGGSSVRVARKVSPYRRVMAELNQKSNASSTTSLSMTKRDISNPTSITSITNFDPYGYLNEPHRFVRHASAATGSWTDESVPYSESVYSRTTSGRTPPPPRPIEEKAPEMSLLPTTPRSKKEIATYKPKTPLMVEDAIGSPQPPPMEEKAPEMSLLHTTPRSKNEIATYKPKTPLMVGDAIGSPPGKAITRDIAVYTPKRPVTNEMTVHESGSSVTNDMTFHTPASASGHQSTSSAGSQDWKKSTSYEVAKENNTPFINYALPTMPGSLSKIHGRHVRENAQINDEDFPISNHPLEVVDQKSFNVPTPLKSILKKEQPPVIPPKSPLRQLRDPAIVEALLERRFRMVSEEEQGQLARGGSTGFLTIGAFYAWVWGNVPIWMKDWF